MANRNSEGLRSARIKIQRAKDHIANLRREKDAWIGRKPYRLTSNVNTKGGKIMLNINVIEPIPDQFSAIMGDAIHNLRSALDHLVWALVIANGETPTEVNQFPINYNLASLEKAIPKCLKGVDPKAISAIKKLQPHKGGYGNPGNEILWSLYDLDRIDKHRMILLVGAAHTKTQLRFSIGYPPQKGFRWIGPPIVAANQALAVPVEDGKTVAEIDIIPLPPEVNLYGAITMEILFGDGNAVSGQPLAEVLPILGKHVEGIINAFDAEFFQ